MVHGAHHVVLFEHHCDGICIVDPRVLLVRRRILAQRILQVLSDADVVDHQSGWLVLEHPVDPRDGLHQPMTPHGLVNVHGVHGGGIEAGQPHVADNNQHERVTRVLRPFGEQIPAGLVAHIGLPGFRIGCRAGHDDFDRAALIVVGMPIGAKGDDLFVQSDTNAAAHADHHGLAVHRPDPVLEMPYQIFCHHLEALLRADECFDGRPFALQALLLRYRLVLGQFLDLGVDSGFFLIGQFDARQPAFVINRHRCAVLDRPADVVNVDVLAEHGGRVGVVLLNRRSGKPDERGVGQRIAQVLGEAIGDLAGLSVQPLP